MTKYFLRLTVISLLLIGLFACGTINNENSSNISPDVLFRDDFSNSHSGWDKVNGVDAVTDYMDGTYRITVNSKNTDVWANPGLNFTDTLIEVETERISGPEDNDFGVICRYQGPGDFYSFLISSDGYYMIAKWVKGEQIALSSEFMEFSDVINQGYAINWIHAECNGSNLELWVNNERIAGVVDLDFKSGDIGLIAGTFDNIGTDIQFDNLVVKKP